MALLLVLLSTILAFLLASTEQHVLSPSSNINLNTSGDWNITGDTGRLSEIVQQGTNNGTEELFSLHDTSRCGAVKPTADTTTTTTTTTTKPTPTTTIITTTTITTTTITTGPTTTPSTRTFAVRSSCPQSGYQKFQGFNCYKAFPSEDEEKTWNEARERCIRDGADLIVMETERERKEVYIKLYNRLNFHDFPWVGVHFPQGGNSWTTVKGESARSTWWESGYPKPESAGKCARAHANGLIVNEDCATPTSFICEISL